MYVSIYKHRPQPPLTERPREKNTAEECSRRSLDSPQDAKTERERGDLTLARRADFHVHACVGRARMYIHTCIMLRAHLTHAKEGYIRAKRARGEFFCSPLSPSAREERRLHSAESLSESRRARGWGKTRRTGEVADCLSGLCAVFFFSLVVRAARESEQNDKYIVELLRGVSIKR